MGINVNVTDNVRDLDVYLNFWLLLLHVCIPQEDSEPKKKKNNGEETWDYGPPLCCCSSSVLWANSYSSTSFARG